MIKKSLALLAILLLSVSAASAGLLSDAFGIAANRVTGAEVAVAQADIVMAQAASPRAAIQCSDSDGISVFMQGTVTYGANSYKDKCVSPLYRGDSKVQEFYCKEDGSFGSVQLECPRGSKCVSSGSGAAFCQLACYDIDDRDPYSGSTAVGYRDASYSEIISESDSCVANALVSESFCNDDGTVGTAIVSCPLGTRCNGLAKRCESVPPVDGCADPDGFDLESKGIAKFGANIVQDTCIIPLQEPDGLKQAVPDCGAGDDCYVKESFCAVLKGGGRKLSTQLAKCPYGCADGKCLGQEAEAEHYCSDSDGGKAYNVKGTVNSDAGSFSDSCSSSMLVEYYCDGLAGKLQKKACPAGCSEGACVEEAVPLCSDSDGDDAFVKGSVVSHLGEQLTDSCMGDDSVMEYFCLNNQVSRKAVGCGIACDDGACIEECIDSDGKDTSTAGVVKTPVESLVDGCVDDNSVLEFTCENGAAMKSQVPCADGKCRDGVCVIEAGEGQSESFKCSDSDNGDIYIKGKATVSGTNGDVASFVDECLNKGTLKEYKCQKATTMEGIGAESILGEVVRCDDGCMNGACIKPASEEPAGAASGCSDSDNGRDYYVAGTLSDNGIEYMDYCSDEARLVEYSCGNGMASEKYECANGCKKGACIKPAVVTSADYESTIKRLKERIASLESEVSYLKSSTSGSVPAASKGFTGASWECYDGEKKSAVGETCKTSESWSKEAEVFCAGHCYVDKSKCGVNYFGVNMAYCDMPSQAGAGEVIYESVKCVFKGAEAKQECYSSDESGRCSGVGSCVMDVNGPKGKEFTWKSTCGGYAYTKMDGENEYAEFECGSPEDAGGDAVEVDAANVVSPAVCGDNACQSGETKLSCPDDCLGAGYGRVACGDGVCDPKTEDSGSCREDCGPSQASIRGKIRSWIQGLS